jgi:hypothetical protein
MPRRTNVKFRDARVGKFATIDRQHERSIGFMPPVYEKEQVRCAREIGLEIRIKEQEKECYRTVRLELYKHPTASS